jgi:hypothetical protein
VSSLIDNLLIRVEEESVKSYLPDNVDKKWIENFLVDIYGDVVYDYYRDNYYDGE